MSGRRRRRRHWGNDDSQIHASDPWGQFTGEAATSIKDIPLGRYTVSERERRDNTTRSTFRPSDGNPHQSRASFQHNDNPFHRQRRFTVTPHSQSDFRRRSAHFKQYILQILNQTLRQVQQWYPDDDCVSESEMDWQPESELVIPQSAEHISYIWDQRHETKVSHLTQDHRTSFEGSSGLGLGLSIPVRRAVSEGNIGLEAGLSPGWTPV